MVEGAPRHPTSIGHISHLVWVVVYHFCKGQFSVLIDLNLVISISASRLLLALIPLTVEDRAAVTETLRSFSRGAEGDLLFEYLTCIAGVGLDVAFGC